MNDRLPYEEQLAQQWNDLPLPDENMAWEDMKRRLDDDDSGILPFWLRGCGLWGLLAVLLLGLGWWVFRPDQWRIKKQVTESIKSIDQKEKNNNNNADDSLHIIKNNSGEKTTTKRKDDSKNPPADTSLANSYPGKKKFLMPGNNDSSAVGITASSKTKRTRNSGSATAKKNTTPINNKEKKQTGEEHVDISTLPGIKNNKNGNDPAETKNDLVPAGKDSIVIAATITGKTGSVQKISPDSIQKKDSGQTVKINEQKKDSLNPKTISFSAGVAMHQLLPVDGQKLVPYNSQGRKASLADYIPSVYFRMNKSDKWFLQAEFRYGAPQYTKEFLYRQNTKTDSAGPGSSFTTTTSSRLKKTFYHQLPLTFNYFVLPNWSIGTGIVWNKFNSAISQQQVNKKNNITQVDSLLSNGIVRDKNDSVFAKSYFQAVFETQYRWRRFSLGARYSFGLQPYIKFILPGGTSQEERNRSLQVFLRYELWKSGAKR